MALRATGLRFALIAGLLLWLSCPPVGLWPLAWVGLAPLIVSLSRAVRLRQAIWYGYAFGCIYLGPVWHWVGLTIVGWTHSFIGWFAWIGLTLILASFYAMWSGATWWLCRRAAGGWWLVAAASAWVVMEWARTLGSLAMPWAQLSCSQYRFAPILQIADTTGAYGISFVLVLFNAAVAHWWLNREQGGRSRWLWTVGTLVVMLSLYGVARLQVTDSGSPLTVAAMQANFNSFHTPPIEAQFQTFRRLTQAAHVSTPPPSLYVWGESTAPYPVLGDRVTFDFMTNLARATQAGILVGSAIEPRVQRSAYRGEADVRADAEQTSRANATFLFTPGGGEPAHYDKQQLVPFGEFTPFGSMVRPLFGQAFGLPDNDVQPGANSKILKFDSPREGPVALGPFICYEAVFPDYARRMTQSGATLLVTQSNESWFQSQAAMEQHQAAVVLRAVENRRQIVRATTTGITCLLDAEGRVTQSAPPNKETFVYGTVQRLQGKTVYTRLGDWFVLVCGGLMVAASQCRRGVRPQVDVPTREGELHGED